MADGTYSAALVERRPLGDAAFEVFFERPPGFGFTPGQRIRLRQRQTERDYSLVNAPAATQLQLCVRRVRGGQMSTWLDSLSIGTRFEFSGPHGYFTFRPSPRRAVFVATGTGIAPFCAMARAGVSSFLLLHGVRREQDLIYADLFGIAGVRRIACISGETVAAADTFRGRVTDYLKQELEPGIYDFYLCGRAEMVRDVTWLVDKRFPESRVYTEIFY
jgi:benzoate/toluate 1,2-dioxygenase reductase subunit